MSSDFPLFDALYDRHHVQVYRYLKAHLKNEHDAADLTQQVFFQAWRQSQTYDSERGSLATWLMSIAHHRLVDFYRVSHPAVSWESLPEIATTDQNLETQVISQEVIVRVRRLLAALSPTDQELLTLRFAAGLSSAEIASVIGKGEAATKKQLNRLLHRLRDEYRRQELEELIPGLLEPTLPAIAAAIQYVYVIGIPTIRLKDVRQSLLEQVQPVSS